MTTVGYGDHVPVTFPGRVVAMFLMVFGVGIFVILTNFVAARLDGLRGSGQGASQGASQDDRHPDWEDMVAVAREENALIRAELAEIKELLQQQGVMVDGEAPTE